MIRPLLSVIQPQATSFALNGAGRNGASRGLGRLHRPRISDNERLLSDPPAGAGTFLRAVPARQMGVYNIPLPKPAPAVTRRVVSSV